MPDGNVITISDISELGRQHGDPLARTPARGGRCLIRRDNLGQLNFCRFGRGGKRRRPGVQSTYRQPGAQARGKATARARVS